MNNDDISFLSQLPMFRGLPRETLDAVIASVEKMSTPPGETIIRKGDRGDAMFIIRRGSVLVPVDDEQGLRKLTACLGPGDFFGEMALLTGEDRAADVIADGEIPVETFVFRKSVVDQLLSAHPRAARFLTEILGRRLIESGNMRHVGKYRLLGEIGKGGGGIVYEGHHPGLNRTVAVKMLAHDLVFEADFAERFKAEAKLVATLRHENIIEVYDTEHAFGTFFIVMERLEGTELSTLIEDGPLSPEEARHILRQTARALNYAHKKGVVHQDVKPSNIFVETNGRVKLMDFGIAGTPVAHADPSNQGIMGTPGYLAPELLKTGVIDGRADIYALGVIAFEMLTGKTAFPLPSKMEVLREQLSTPHLSLPTEFGDDDDALAAFVARATANDPAARHQDCRAVLLELDEPNPLDKSQLDGVTLTVIFDKRDRERINAIVKKTTARLHHVDGAIVTVGNLVPHVDDDHRD